MLSGFKWQSLDGKLNTVPVIYGDMSKQVAMLIKENSESKARQFQRLQFIFPI
jgi:hypothetical protein